jgi:hypothetical protein
MQVLSQLSYNPTVGPLIGVLSDACPARLEGDGPISPPLFCPAARRVSSAAVDRRLAPFPARLDRPRQAYWSRVSAVGRVYRSVSGRLKTANGAQRHRDIRQVVKAARPRSLRAVSARIDSLGSRDAAVNDVGPAISAGRPR